jgi:hypothetical protein
MDFAALLPESLIAVSSSLSIIACIILLGCFLKFEESRRCGRRILFFLNMTDLLGAITWLLTLLPSISHPNDEPVSIPFVCFLQVVVFPFHVSLYLLISLAGLRAAIFHPLVVLVDVVFCISLVSNFVEGQQNPRGIEY